MKKVDLLKGIKAVLMGIDKSSAVGSDFILFDENWVRSYKEDISVSFPLETGIRTAVRAEELYKVLSKMEAEEIDIKMTEEGKLQVKGGKTTLKMNPLQKEQITSSLERAWAVQTDGLEWFYLPKDFQVGMELCSFSAGTGPALGPLAGVHFFENKVVSTDNYRVSVYTMLEAVSSSFTLPTKTVEGLLKIEENFEIMALSKAWAHFSNDGGAIYSSRVLAGDYPSKKIIGLFEAMKFDMISDPLEFPKGLEAPLERAKILAGASGDGWESLSKVSLSYSKGTLEIRAGKEAGEIVDGVDWKKDHFDEGLEIRVQPDFFKKILGITRQFRLSPTKKSLLFSSEKFNHIMVASLGSGK